VGFRGGMGEGDSLHQQPFSVRDLGTGVRIYELPLLPYERQLIETLGCTEQEYRRFAYLAAKRGALRPAEYALIPDVQNGPAATGPLIQLAIGLVLGAASMLLTPKPKQVSRVETVKLGDVTGRDRFSPTSGFDSQAELADYASPIPIIFGRYTGKTGGIVAAPRLVWSRAFSLGTQQMVKQLYVVGEQGVVGPPTGIDLPELNGIFLGNSPLDVIYNHEFAFYWKKNSVGFTRIQAANLAYGTRGKPDSGDIETDNDIFLCPTRSRSADTGFCSAHTPSNQTQFGVYGAIANGTNYRVNWRVVSIPEIEGQDDDPKDRLLAERIKIAGDYDLNDSSDIRRQGQRGVGRNYGRRMGIVALNGTPVSDSGSTPIEVRTASVGDIVTFSIATGKLPADTYKRKKKKIVKVDDINQAVDGFRRNADDMLQVGENIMIGRTAWVVQSRSASGWDSNTRQNITLKCVETFGSGLGASIGLISERMLGRGIYNDDNGATNARNGRNMSAGIGFYPLTKVSFGVVRNTRPCDVTEIGLKSQVWNKLNGICNFSEIPSGLDLLEAEKDKISYEAGTQNIYIARTSVWTIFIRNAGTDANGTAFPWHPLGEQFCITGQTPQDVYNSIRIKHPERRQYEFKFVPKSGADVARHSPASELFLRLNAKTGKKITRSFVTAISPTPFEVTITGDEVTAGDIRLSPEMTTDPGITASSVTQTVPDVIGVDKYLPDLTTFSSQQVETVAFLDFLPLNVRRGRKVTFTHQIFGNANYMGQTKTVDVQAGDGSGRTLNLKISGVVQAQFPANHDAYPNDFAWEITNISVNSSNGRFQPNSTFEFQVNVAGNPKASRPAAGINLTTGGLHLKIQTLKGRNPGGRESAFEEEILGDAENQSIGTVKSETFDVTKGSKFIRVKMTGTVVARPEPTKSFFNKDKAWQNVTFQVDPLFTSDNWSIGDTFDYEIDLSSRSGNEYAQDRDSVGARFEILNLATTVLPAGLTGERLFEHTTQIADISQYGNLVQKSNESAPEHEIVYVNESVANDVTPDYAGMTLTGLSLKSSRNFSQLDQLRFWLADGIPVTRFSDGGHGASNKFTDLVYYLLTDKVAGTGNVVSSQLINTSDLATTGKFLESNKLFFDGAIDQAVNLRDFIGRTAPFFLCNFVISDGKFSLLPALPTDTNGNISQSPIKISALFTQGNIIEGTYGIEYLSAEERKDFQAVVRYREERQNQLPSEKTLVVRRAASGASDHPVESFDLTQFCTSRDHAFLVARYFLTLRKRVTHSVRFKTNPFGISLAPGSFIRVVTESSPYQSANNGTINADGTITSATEVKDGSYSIVFYQSLDDKVTEATMTVSGGKVLETALHDSLFTISDSTVSSNTYMVEQLTLGEDGMVDVMATEFPTTSTYNSKMAADVLNTSAYTTEG
jgi:hypothetical protein